MHSCVIFLVLVTQLSRFNSDTIDIDWTEAPSSFIGGTCSEVGVEIHEDTLYTFGGQCGFDASATTYWTAVDNILNENTVSWSQYSWHNDSNVGISRGFRVTSTIKIDDLVYIGAPYDLYATMLIFNLTSQSQVSLSSYSYQIGFPSNIDTSWSEPCSVTNGTHLFYIGGQAVKSGGPTDGYNLYDTMYIYDISNDAWSMGPTITSGGRSGHSCNYDEVTNVIWVFGGYKSYDTFIAINIFTTFIYYDLNTLSWSNEFTMDTARVYHESVLMSSSLFNSNNNNLNFVLLVAGYDSVNIINGVGYVTESAVINVSNPIDPSVTVIGDSGGISGNIQFNGELPSTLSEISLKWINNGNYINYYNQTTNIGGNTYQITSIFEYQIISIGGTSDSSYSSSIYYATITHSIPVAVYTVPTTDPTTQPTVMPTNTTSDPTRSPSDTTSSEQDTTVAPGNSTDVGSNVGGGNGNNGEFALIQTAVAIVFIISIITPFMLLCIAKLYHNGYQGSDRPNYSALFKVAWNIGDFYSDMLFALDLLLQNHYLFIYCGIFAVGPHLISNVIGLIVSAAWQDKSVRLRNYLNNYQSLVVAISVFAGFYSAIDICKSKLFYWKGFSMQIKKSEYQSVRLIRFFNVVVLENIPQFGIQIIYAIEKDFDIIVFSAMFFSVLSLLISSFQQIARCLQSGFNSGNSNGSSSDVVVHETRYKIKMTGDSNASANKLIFAPHHKYTHTLLGSCIAHILDIDQANVEVLYIYEIHNGLIAVFDLCTFEVINNNPKRRYTADMTATSTASTHRSLEMLNIQHSEMYAKFTKELKQKLKLSHVDDLIVNLTMMDERQKNATDTIKTHKEDGSTVTIKIDSESRMTQRMNMPPIHMSPRILEAAEEDSFEKENDYFRNSPVRAPARPPARPPAPRPPVRLPGHSPVMSASASPRTVPMRRAPPPPPGAY